MKAKVTAFLDNLITYDYVLFSSAFTLFILFIILGLILRKKVALAIFFVILAFLILILVPSLGYSQMHKYLFKNTTSLTQQKRLQFTDAIVVRGDLINESKRNFKSCKITAKVHKVSKNKYKNYILKFKIIKRMSIIEKDISKGKTRNFKIIIEPFTYSKDYNITIGAKCK